MTVVVTELTIMLNSLTGRYTLGPAGQLIPFVLGVYALIHVQYRHRWPEKKETRARDQGAELFIEAWLGDDDAVRKYIDENTGKEIRESKYGGLVLHVTAAEHHPQNC